MRKSTSGSSILKPQKPRQPLQVVNFDSSLDENNPPTKIKRRVSFAEKKHVKEFCHTTEQGTVWDSTYEEHDCSSKGSLDQNSVEESNKKLEYISKPIKNAYIENNVNCSNNTSLENNGPSEPVMRTNEEDDMISDMNCISSILCTKLLDNCSQIENIPPLASSTLSNDNEAYNVTDKMSQQEIYTSPSARATSDVSKIAVPSNIIVYKDSDEEDCVGNRAKHFKSSTNDTCKMDKTYLRDDSMELTTVVPVSSMILHTEEQNIIQNDDKMHLNDLCTNCTTNFNNVSMEITQAVPTPKQFINCGSNIFEHVPKQVKTCLSTTYNVRSDVHNDAIFGAGSTYMNDSMVLTTAIPTNANLMCTNDPNLNVSMEITNAIGKILGGTAPRLYSESAVAGRDQIERIKYFNDISMDMTEPVNTLLSNVCNKENLKSHGATSADDRSMIFHNVSMEMTKPVSSRIHEASINPVTCKLTCEEDIQKEVTSNSTCSSAKHTRFLNEPMELTEAVPNVLYNERTLDATRASLVSDTMRNTQLPAKNIAHTIDYIPLNKGPIQSASHHSTEDATSKKLENLIISENKCLLTRDTTQSPKSSPMVQRTYPDLTESTCYANAVASQIQDVSMEITTALPVSSHLTQDVTVNKVEDENKELQQSITKDSARKSLAQENQVSMETLQTKNTHNKPSNISIDLSLSDHSYKNSCKINNHNSVKLQSFQKNNVHEALKVDDNQSFVDTKKNLEDSLNESSECSFLRKSLPYLENSCDLQSINPPSLMHSEEEISFHDAPGNHRFQVSTNVNQVPDITHESFAQFVTTRTLPKHLRKSRKGVAKYNESFTVLRNKKESINVENSETNDRHGNIEETNNIEDKEVNIQTIARTEHDLDRQTLIDLFYQGELLQKCIDLNQVKVAQIKSTLQINVTEDKVKSQQSMGHVQDHIEENLPTEKPVVTLVKEKSVVTPVKEKPLTEEDHFLLLSQKLERCGERDDCIWNVFRKNVDRKLIVFGFMANSLLIATFLVGNLTRLKNPHKRIQIISRPTGENSPHKRIKIISRPTGENSPHTRIKIISRLTDKADVLIRIVHKLLLQKVNAETLERHEKIFSMLDFMSQEVKLAMDFMFDLRRLNDSNIMEIACDKISFMSVSKNMNIILRITIEVKVFDKLTPNDINVHCVLGTVREKEVKNLIKNIKRDSKFLRRYMNDVKYYIDIMENVNH